MGSPKTKQLGNQVKHLLILISILLLSSPVFGEETGVLFLREVNDNWGWFEDGNEDEDAKYIGEFKDGFFEDRQPNGQGTITYPNGNKYVGRLKDGEKDGQGTFTFSDGERYVGKFKDDELWNGTTYDKNRNIYLKYMNGKLG